MFIKLIKKIVNKFKLSKSDVWLGVIIIVIAYYLHGINASLSGFYRIDYPMDGKNHFYYKKLYDGNKLLIFIKKDKIYYVVYYELLDKRNNIIDKGSMPISEFISLPYLGVTYNKDKNISFPMNSYKKNVLKESVERQSWTTLLKKSGNISKE